MCLCSYQYRHTHKIKGRGVTRWLKKMLGKKPFLMYDVSTLKSESFIWFGALEVKWIHTIYIPIHIRINQEKKEPESFLW